MDLNSRRRWMCRCNLHGFKKAFDTAPHQRLLAKISNYGMKGKVLEWIKIFLTNRKQRIVVNGSFSKFGFFNISDSMHDNEIKVVSISTFSWSRIMIKLT